ncbi:MAG: (E)-4-hydroxy-3-methylbut-2-enyl-diphosphate synthase [Chloroflexi bacterium]|nr:(E)-4-hydroxy-3-methylbut-2-enyl-diphosphate synthase [Chloroflexota bacterium]
MPAPYLPYVPDLYTYHRRPTRTVMVGDVGVGGDNPIRVQSMTTTLTKDVAATADQVERLVRVGCEIVRITTPTPADARCLGPIKERLAARGIHVPIVADIHFNPLAALAAADFADKVRVNPGNYADSRKFAVREYSDEEYAAELSRVEERFAPLVLKCRERGIAMRIGTNHGSLSDRIMNRFGDTPEGMVESALEFVRICEKYGYRDIILSMKASNPKVMVAAYRLLAARMADLGMDYPFHLGVTEAGNAEDGRIKSAIGIGSLLEDGIGDTIRVSLTEEPEEEIPVAYAIAGRYRPQGASASRPPAGHGQGLTSADSPTLAGDRGELVRASTADSPPIAQVSGQPPWDPYHFERRPTRDVGLGGVRLGGANTVAVLSTVGGPLAAQQTAMARLLRWASPAGRRQPKPDEALVHLQGTEDLAALRRIARRLRRWPQAQLALIAGSDDTALLLDALPEVDGVLQRVGPAGEVTLLASAVRDAGKTLVLDVEVRRAEDRPAAIEQLLDAAADAMEQESAVVLTVTAADEERIHAYRLLASEAARRGVQAPIVLQAHLPSEPLLPASITLGSLLCDGIGDALLLGGMEDGTELAFNILQASGTRLSRTDYVACPSCGRTLFDLQETTERIKSRTSHLVGVKLAIMGCIVNGPGEMADADFGYVGGAPGQVNLYVGKECVEKGVPAEQADDRLVELIKAHGKWQEADEDS